MLQVNSFLLSQHKHLFTLRTLDLWVTPAHLLSSNTHLYICIYIFLFVDAPVKTLWRIWTGAPQESGSCWSNLHGSDGCGSENHPGQLRFLFPAPQDYLLRNDMTETRRATEVASSQRLGVIFFMEQSWWTDCFSYFGTDNALRRCCPVVTAGYLSAGEPESSLTYGKMAGAEASPQQHPRRKPVLHCLEDQKRVS